jgi:hypothetical protein
MTVTTRKTNATAHPGVPDLPTTSRRSSKAVAEERRAVQQVSEAETRLALEHLQAVSTIEEKMAKEDAIERARLSRPRSEADEG